MDYLQIDKFDNLCQDSDQIILERRIKLPRLSDQSNKLIDFSGLNYHPKSDSMFLISDVKRNPFILEIKNTSLLIDSPNSKILTNTTFLKPKSGRFFIQGIDAEGIQIFRDHGYIVTESLHWSWKTPWRMPSKSLLIKFNLKTGRFIKTFPLLKLSSRFSQVDSISRLNSDNIFVASQGAKTLFSLNYINTIKYAIFNTNLELLSNGNLISKGILKDIEIIPKTKLLIALHANPNSITFYRIPDNFLSKSNFTPILNYKINSNIKYDGLAYLYKDKHYIVLVNDTKKIDNSYLSFFTLPKLDLDSCINANLLS
tara:strand:- start:767 stop:1705 length:939 start_codon:yes stop_codon:yes gene_type:complete